MNRQSKYTSIQRKHEQSGHSLSGRHPHLVLTFQGSLLPGSPRSELPNLPRCFTGQLGRSRRCTSRRLAQSRGNTLSGLRVEDGIEALLSFGARTGESSARAGGDIRLSFRGVGRETRASAGSDWRWGIC